MYRKYIVSSSGVNSGSVKGGRGGAPPAALVQGRHFRVHNDERTDEPTFSERIRPVKMAAGGHRTSDFRTDESPDEQIESPSSPMP